MKRFFAYALVICLLLGVMPTGALAADDAMNARLDAAIAANFHIPKEVYDASQHTLVAKEVEAGRENKYNNTPEYYMALYDDGTLLIDSDGSGTLGSPSSPVEDRAGEVKLAILSERVAEVPSFYYTYDALETIVSLYDEPLDTEPATIRGPGLTFNAYDDYYPPKLKTIVLYGNIPRSHSIPNDPLPAMTIYYRDGHPDWEDKSKNSFRFPTDVRSKEALENVTFQKICGYTYEGGIDTEHGSTTSHTEKVLDYTSSAAELYDTVSVCDKCGQEVEREHHYTVGGKEYNDYTPRELTVNMPTVAEIKEFFAAHPIKSETTFTRAPSYAQEPYDLGAYDAATRQSIMNEINRYRFAAGVPAELEYTPVNEPQEMAAALVMKVSGQLTHTPERTNGLEKPEYDDMLTHRWKWGANGANIASWGNIMSAIQAFMWDSDITNVLAGLGHRRHMLKSNLQDVAAGEAGEYACLFVSQTKGAHSGWYDPVAWPARNTPTSYFSGRWSVVYGGAEENLTGHNFRVEILSEDGELYSSAENADAAVVAVDGQVNFGHTLTIKPDTIYSVAVFDDTAKTFMTYDVSFFEYTDEEGHAGAPAEEQTSPSNSASGWAKEDVSQAIAAGLVPDNLQHGYTQPITREDFCELANALYKKVKGDVTPTAAFTDTTSFAVQKMATVGVVNGIGNGLFDPYGDLTREQAATMLYRLAAAAGKPLPDVEATFADKDDIASWASKEVGAIQAADIMKGVGNDRFDPQGSYTIEQSILTMLRMYRYLNQ